MPAPLVSVVVSVVVPTCHRNDLLAKCLDCLAPGVQTLPAAQYEVIVTDDGSRSTAQHLVRNSYPWAQWAQGPRRGPAANRNQGAALAQGHWLAFTDDDCLPAPGWLKAFVQAAQAKSEENRVYENRVYENSVYEGCTTCTAGIVSPLYAAPINLKGGVLWSCNLMFRTSFFQAVQGFDADYGFSMEDIDMRERLRRQQVSAFFVSDAVVDHPPRRQPSGIEIGRRAEGALRFWYKFGNTGSYWLPFAKHIKHSLYCLSQHRPSRDLLIAYGALCLEIAYVTCHLPCWQRRFHRIYAAAKD